MEAGARKKTLAETIQGRVTKIGVLGILVGAGVWVWPLFNRYVLLEITLLSAGLQIMAYSVLVIAAAIVFKTLMPLINGIFWE